MTKLGDILHRPSATNSGICVAYPAVVDTSAAGPAVRSAGCDGNGRCDEMTNVETACREATGTVLVLPLGP